MSWKDYFLILQPELSLALIIVIILLIKVGMTEMKKESFLTLINLLLVLNFIAGILVNTDGSLFHEMYHSNALTRLEKTILNGGVLLISWQSYAWLKLHRHAEEFYMLLLASLMGMDFMISSNNLLQFYLALELSTIPLAALCNFDLLRKRSSEAAMKLILNSAFSSGLLLMGISFIYGATGSLDFPVIVSKLASSGLMIFAFLLIISGFGFKVSAVPFHLWTADVYEGSPVPVTSFLSVISKGALFFVFTATLYAAFKPLELEGYRIICILAVLTMVIGNLFALRQTNIKRLLAFSSIAQSGFILVYLFSNLGAFGVVSVISTYTGKENISDYAGLYKSNPFLAWVMAISLFSLAGVPPTAGFFGKFFLLLAGASKANYLLIVIAALNMVVALYYYLMVVKTMFLPGDSENGEKIPISMLSRIALVICVAGILSVGLIGGIYDFINSVTANF